MITNENIRAHFPNKFSFVDKTPVDLLRNRAYDFQRKSSTGVPHVNDHSNEIMRLVLALREIRPEDLTDELSEQFFQANDHLWNVIARIQRRKQPKQQQKLKI